MGYEEKGRTPTLHASDELGDNHSDSEISKAEGGGPSYKDSVISWTWTGSQLQRKGHLANSPPHIRLRSWRYDSINDVREGTADRPKNLYTAGVGNYGT